MELKKVTPFENVATPELKKPQGPQAGVPKGQSFADTLSALSGNSMQGQPLSQMPGLQQMPKASDVGAVKFSNHAVERMMSRGIKYSPEDLKRLGEAVNKAAAKGAKDSLILMNDSALIVSVKNNTVVTVMDKNALKENVFTNIDSTVVL